MIIIAILLLMILILIKAETNIQTFDSFVRFIIPSNVKNP